MAQYQAGERRSSSTHHVLVGTADIGRNHLENDAVADFPALRIFQLGKIDRLHLDSPGPDVYDAMIVRHGILLVVVDERSNSDAH
jgi:hypothetical protein